MFLAFIILFTCISIIGLLISTSETLFPTVIWLIIIGIILYLFFMVLPYYIMHYCTTTTTIIITKY